MSTSAIQRIENALIAVAIMVAFIVADYPWWVLFVLFLAFDLSALPYLWNTRIGAISYNVIHNYAGPAALAIVYLIGAGMDADMRVVGIVAGCWAFHVAVDRALGYGLKEGSGFRHTHLGTIGRLGSESANQP